MKVAIVTQPKSGIVNLSIWSAGKGARFICLGRRKHLVLFATMFVCVMGAWFAAQLSIMSSNAEARAEVLSQPVPVGAEVVFVKAAEPKADKLESSNSRGWLRKLIAKMSPQDSAPSRVLPFDGSRVLSRGDKVVVRFGDEVTIAVVAGAPRETVLLRRGQTLERLYVLGDESYAVMANQQSKIVRASDITATISVPLQMARN
jgi:hypothetical protein